MLVRDGEKMAGREGEIWRSCTRPEFLAYGIRNCLAISTQPHLSLDVNLSRVVSSIFYRPIFWVGGHSQYKTKQSKVSKEGLGE